MKKTLFVFLPLLLAVLFIPLLGFAQQQAPQAKSEAAAEPGQHHGMTAGKKHGKMEMDKDRMARHDKMVADMKAMDARLDEKVAAMNVAKEDQKVAAMAAVINELVAQRKEMRDKFAGRHHGKMGGMMCPMMDEMGGMMGKQGEAQPQGASPTDTGKKEGAN